MLIHQEVFFGYSFVMLIWFTIMNMKIVPIRLVTQDGMNWYFHYFDLLPSIITCLNPFVYNRLELCTSYIEIKELTMAIINSIYTSTVLTGIRIEYHLIFWCFG